MNFLKRTIFPILIATIWITFSEFVRNEIFVKSLWVEHYQKSGIVFPSEPINGALWVLWALFFAIFISLIAPKFSLFQTTFLGWLVGFVLMWLVIGNLGVLPIGTLWVAVPLSLLEVFLAVFIIKKLTQKEA